MSVKIRMKRTGRKNRPYYRICVMDTRTKRDGRPIEEIGSYDAQQPTLEQKVVIDAERAAHWLSVGAQPSETVASILRRMGITRQGVREGSLAATLAARAAEPTPAASASASPDARAASPSRDAPAASPSPDAPAASGDDEPTDADR